MADGLWNRRTLLIAIVCLMVGLLGTISLSNTPLPPTETSRSLVDEASGLGLGLTNGTTDQQPLASETGVSNNELNDNAQDNGNVEGFVNLLNLTNLTVAAVVMDPLTSFAPLCHSRNLSERFLTVKPNHDHYKLRTWKGGEVTSEAVPGYAEECALGLRQNSRLQETLKAYDTEWFQKERFYTLPFSRTLLSKQQCLPDSLFASQTPEKMPPEETKLVEQVLRKLQQHNWTVEVWYMAGRKKYLGITSKYLKPMLKRFGGVASRVLWMHTPSQTYVPEYMKLMFRDSKANKKRLQKAPKWGRGIDERVDKKAKFKVRSENIPEFVPFVRGNIRRMYNRAHSVDHGQNKIFVKFDDDTVFVSRNAVTYIVAATLGIPLAGEYRDPCNCVIASANVVNHVGLNPVHFHQNALNLNDEVYHSYRKKLVRSDDPLTAAIPSSTTTGFGATSKGPFDEDDRLARRHVGLHKGIAYEGIRKAATGSFQHPFEWKRSHLSFLTHLLRGTLSAYYFDQQDGYSGGVYNFNCDEYLRRWGINFFAFPTMAKEHAAGMRELGHLWKNKDEIYFSMMFAHSGLQKSQGTPPDKAAEKARKKHEKKSAPLSKEARMAHSVRSTTVDESAMNTCAVGKAIVVHFLNTGQASNIRKMFGISEDDAWFKDASNLQPRLLKVYDEIAAHVSGVDRCCRSTGCSVFGFAPADILRR